MLPSTCHELELLGRPHDAVKLNITKTKRSTFITAISVPWIFTEEKEDATFNKRREKAHLSQLIMTI